MDQLAELTLPRPAFETNNRAPKIVIGRNEIPWLPQDEEIQLKRRILPDGQEFLLASLIRGKKLIDAANKLDRKGKHVTDNLLNSFLAEFLRSPHSKVVTQAITRKPIYYVGNPAGQRVYLMRFGSIEGLPIFLRLAVCDKVGQPQVLSVLTGSSISAVLKKAS